jgi:hypothetical protein
MLIRRELFHALEGFDPVYAPAYYEDLDLCLRVAQHGMTVVYEPRSAVTHLRYGSGDFDRAAELSERNRTLFRDRWGSQLVGRPSTFRGTSAQAVIAARDARATPRVLICAGPGDRAAERVALLVLSRWGQARVTWATGGDRTSGFDPAALLGVGVEVLDESDPSWLSGRLFHYDLAVLRCDPHPSLLAALDATQPQATRSSLADLEGAPETLLPRLTTVMARAGIAPPPRIRDVNLRT